MTSSNELPHSLHPASLGKRIVQGAGLALLLAALFMTFFYQGANLAFGLWTVLPLLTVPTAGAFGGVLYYLLDVVRRQGRWPKLLANVFFALAYCAMLWVSLVLAFAVTGLWD